MPAREFVKGDRAARLVRIANLLREHTHGLTAREVADRVHMGQRTIYRDFRALDDVIGVTLWQDGTRYGVTSDSFLAPLKLSLQEGVTLFLAARLMDRFQDRSDPHVVTAFEKLATVLPPPLAEHVQATLASMASRPRKGERQQIFDLLASAWAERRKVRIWYPPSTERARGARLVERLVSPYYLEPNPNGRTLYLICHDAGADALRTFRIERIQRAEPTQETFDPPAGMDVVQRLRSSFVISDEDLVEIRLRFHEGDAATRAAETEWHPSQHLSRNGDGTLDMVLHVSGLRDVTHWILGWGSAVEVLAPPELRRSIEATLRAATARYDAAVEKT